MNNSVWLKWFPTGLGVSLVALLVWWFTTGHDATIVERTPGMDRAEGASSTNAASTKWDGQLTRQSGAAPDGFSGIWPMFRGPQLNGISPDTNPVARSWPDTGPKVLWSIDVDEGYASPAVWKGLLYLIDYDTKNQRDALRCLSLADGQELWRYTYPVRIKRFHGRTRTIPAVTEQCVISLGPKCHVLCLDPATGEYRWHINLVQEYGTEVPEWYAGQCPLIDQGRLLLAPGNDALMLAIELPSGKVLWKTPNPRQWKMTHSSITPIEFNGRRMYVYCASGGVVGVDAATGQILWETTAWTVKMANIPAPVYLGDGRIFLCGGYGAGSMMIQLKDNAGTLTPEIAYTLKPAVFGSEQQTPIFHNQHLFGVRPKPDEQLVCLDPTGKVVWGSGTTNKFGAGPYMVAQDLLFLMNNQGVLTLAEASTTGYKRLAQARVIPNAHDSWGPMVLVDGRLLVRDMTRLVCLDVTGR